MVIDAAIENTGHAAGLTLTGERRGIVFEIEVGGILHLASAEERRWDAENDIVLLNRRREIRLGY